MARVKVVGTNLDSNLNGTNFNNTTSQVIFSFGKFIVTTNLSGRKFIDYTRTLNSFSTPITLDSINLTTTESEIIQNKTTRATLNLDRSNLNTYVRFGSAYEFLRVSIENIILAYPASLFANSQTARGGNITFFDFSYDITTNLAIFKVPTAYIVNTYKLITKANDTTRPEDKAIKNLNLSFSEYVVWSPFSPSNVLTPVVGYTGDSSTRNYLTIQTYGDPFAGIVTGATTSDFDFHIKPSSYVFEEFRQLLSDYERYIVSARDDNKGFRFNLKNPNLLDDGSIVFNDTNLLWTTTDKYNIDINTPSYERFLDSVLTIAEKYDLIKTNLIARFLTPNSIKLYDLTENGKVSKLLKTYGWEFDQIRQFIDALVNINRTTYDKVNNLPDQIVKNLARTFGWDYFSLVNEQELVESFLTIDETERNLNTDLMPAEIDIELWRRILINTNYFWKSKGTREAIKAMFLLIGIPAPFVNITEYVYTVDGKINPNSVQFTINDFPSQSLPYDKDGYPAAPLETDNFYFQISGDTDAGQAYMDVFRMVGFNLTPVIDNKKSWVRAGATTRVSSETPKYYQADSKLVINTKEVDIALDTSQGIEYDVFRYINEQDYPYNSSGYTIPYKYVNVSLGYTGVQNTFTLPVQYNKAEGDIEVRFNGLLLNGPKDYSGGTGTYTELTGAHYTVSGNTFTILGMSAVTNTYGRDVIEATYVYSGGTSPLSGVTVQYLVTRVELSSIGATIPLPVEPSGDIQVTLNRIALTKGTNQFIGDYIINPNNKKEIIIQNQDVINYLNKYPSDTSIQVAYVTVTGSTTLAAQSEIYRIDTFSGSKLYYNSTAHRYVYRLNYKINNTSDVKILVDGMGLEPTTDYYVNVNNRYEIFMPNGLKYGSVISAYYFVGGTEFLNPIIDPDFGLGDIGEMSFLEFVELTARRLINARTRKTISDFKGGWYPTLLRVYEMYLNRAFLETTDPLHSNGYTFRNLYPFLSKYNAFFQKFVDQLLSATIIIKRGGLLIRNSVFTKQKFMYKRGVNLYSGTTNIDMRGNAMLQYLGDDGSMFMILQSDKPAPTDLSLKTTVGIAGSDGVGLGYISFTGGEQIFNYLLVDGYGMKYRILPSGVWQTLSFDGPLPSGDNYFTANILGLTEGATYEYAATVKAGNISATGDTLQITIPILPPPPVLIPTGHTIMGTFTSNSIINTGGYVLPNVPAIWQGITWYGMEYSAGTTTDYVTHVPTVTTGVAGSLSITTFNVNGSMVTNKGGLPVLEYGILYSDSPLQDLRYENLANINRVPIYNDIDINVAFNNLLTNLLGSTWYYFRAYAKNATGFGYGIIKSAKTTANPTSPVLALAVTISSITTTSATASGSVSSDGGSALTETGFVWSTTINPTTSNNKVVAGTSLGTIIGSLTGLQPNTLYHVRAFASNALGTSYSDDVTFTTNVAYGPTVTTINPSNIQITLAVAGGSVSNDGGMPVTARGVVWSTNPLPTIANSKTTDGTGIGTYSSTMTPLIASTTYYYRAYATNVMGTGYGAQVTFTTLAANLPTVTTTVATSITQTTATAGGNVTSTGGADVTEKGIVYGTLPSPTLANNRVTDGTGVGSFTSYIIALTPGTTYYYRAYATNSTGTAYGAEYNFTTGAALVLSSPSVSASPSPLDIQSTTATIGGNVTSDGNSTITARGTVWSTSPTPTILSNKTTDGTGTGSFQSTLTGLLPNTTYYARTYATNAIGTSYSSNEIIFTTLISSPNTITESCKNLTLYVTGDATDWAAPLDAKINYSFINSYINAQNTSGYFLLAGNELVSSSNGYLDGEVITGNKFVYSGGHAELNGISQSITHGIFTGYQKNAVIRYNYLDKVPMAIIRKSNGGTDTGGGVAYNIIKNPFATGVVCKGIKGVKIYNNTFYSDQPFYSSPSSGTRRGLIDIYSNDTPVAASGSISVKNNIFYVVNDIYTIQIEDIASAVNLDIDYNVYYCEATVDHKPHFNYLGASYTWAQWQALGYDAHSVVVNPNFIDLTNFVPSVRLDNGISLGAEFQTGLATNAQWVVCSAPATTDQNGAWQVGAVVYAAGLSVVAPTVTTSAVSSIGDTTALGGGNVTSAGGGTVSSRGIVYGLTTLPKLGYDNVLYSGSGTGSFTASMTSLISNTKYYVRSFAINEAGTSYGNEVNFTTLVGAVTSPPTVTTTFPAIDIQPTTATIGGNVTSDGNSTVTARGTAWSTIQNPTTSNNKTIDGSGTGSFQSILTGLSPNSIYYARTYATNAIGTSYGAQISITTTFAVTGNVYYVATTGSDSNTGTFASPFATIQRAVSAMAAGDIVYVRAGTYSPTGTAGTGDGGTTYCGVYINGKNGTASKMYRIVNYPNETVILDGSNITNAAARSGILLNNCSYFHIKGITVQNVNQHSSGSYFAHGIELMTGNNNLIENCVSCYNGGAGYKLRVPNGHDTHFLNCDSHHNFDPYTALPGDDADGYDIGYGANDYRIRLTGCRAWNNGDDGYDMYQRDGYESIYILTNCWSWHNGYAPDGVTPAGNGCGFKFGADLTGNYSVTRRFAYNCIAYDNLTRGFSQESANIKKELYNNIAYANKAWGFSFIYFDTPDIVKNNVSFGNVLGSCESIGVIRTSTNNTWDAGMPSASASDFVSINGSTLSSARQSNGTLPIITFLHLKAGSLLIGKGVTIASNTADGDNNLWANPPSIGAYEFV